ncbi:MAG: TIGR04211 family SH3 domain-containing protein [Halorhodospira sp.]
MRKNIAPLVLLLTALAVVLPATPATGEERWVGDQLTISFRSGAGSQYGIERFLRTGAPVEVLEPPEDAEEEYGEAALENWIYVRDLEEDDEGWVQGRYLIDERPARVRIGEVEEELVEAEEQIADLEDEVAAREDEKEELEEQLASAQDRIETLEADLEEASEGYELVEANEELQQRVNRLLERNEELERQNEGLTQRSRQEWFLAGAGVLFGGVILGLILPRLRPRRRDRWGSSL